MGAAGVRKVIAHLGQQGHRPIELERGSTGYKIWKSIKIKRVRVPDILCIDSGIRVESRAKTKLIISMSHSYADDSRGWDFGLADDDYVALVVCEKNGERPIDWRADDNVQYIKVADLRAAFIAEKVIHEKPKGALEGFETRLTWPCSIASSDGQIVEISNRLKYKRISDGRTISLALTKKGIALTPLVRTGQRVRRHQILASVSPVAAQIPHRTINPGDYYRKLLASASISDRYVAARAYSYLDHHFAAAPLIERLNDSSEHIYVKLEAAAALARANNPLGYEFIEAVLESDYLAHRLESVIILGELPSERSAKLLAKVLRDVNQHEEIRSGAAWALGEINLESSIPSLVSAFDEMSLPIRHEAARSIKKLCDSHADMILERFEKANSEERPGISWALGRYGKWDLPRLIDRIDKQDLDMRQWGAYIIGNSDQARMINDIERLKTFDPELYFAATVLWKISSSWVDQLQEY